MLITILTLFPGMFSGFLDDSIIKRARDRNICDIRTVQIRDFATDKHRSVDDKPFGGGQGMLLRVDIVHKALDSVLIENPVKRDQTRIILTDAGGIQYTQNKAQRYSSSYLHLVIICGHYEGIDARIRGFADESVSVGPYVLTGGELPAAVIADSVVRLLPGAVHDQQSVADESYSTAGVIEYPQYTKPRSYQNLNVPEVLISGNHGAIVKWKKNQRVKRSSTA